MWNFIIYAFCQIFDGDHRSVMRSTEHVARMGELIMRAELETVIGKIGRSY